MPKYQEHIVSDPRLLMGKPVIKGTRISVVFILKKLSEGAAIEEVASQYGLQLEDLYAALAYASDRLAERDAPLS